MAKTFVLSWYFCYFLYFSLFKKQFSCFLGFMMIQCWTCEWAFSYLPRGGQVFFLKKKRKEHTFETPCLGFAFQKPRKKLNKSPKGPWERPKIKIHPKQKKVVDRFLCYSLKTCRLSRWLLFGGQQRILASTQGFQNGAG